MPKKVTYKIFLLRAQKKHGKKYDYSRTNFNLITELVEIICPNHGSFWQCANEHIRGRGCKKCAFEKISTSKLYSFEKFLSIAEEKHGKETYDYSIAKETFVNLNTDIEIGCKIHGFFLIKPKQHIKAKGTGCKKCSNEKRILNEKNFLEKANKQHNNKYVYPEKYFKSKNKIKIICPIHGTFEQTPNNHLTGYGCQKCGGNIKLSHEEFVKKANIVHMEKYEYPESYTNSQIPIHIKCNLHGFFKQKPYEHLNKRGCPKCAISRISKNQLCLYEHIKNNINKNTILEKTIKLKTDNKQYFADIFIPEKNIIIEYYGDYWHCNPKKYSADYYHPHKKIYAKNIWNYDNKRKKKLEKLGCKVIIAWESDFKENKNKTIKNILKEIK